MGITAYTAERLSAQIKRSRVRSVIEFGSQNLYIGQPVDKPPFADEFYKSRGVETYHCIDLGGDNNAIKWDLSKERDFPRQYDLVTDIGTSEHIVQMNSYTTVPFHDNHIHSIYPSGEIGDIRLGYYNAWKNKHKLCKIGGLIYSENPKTGNWPEHGYTYITMDFYTRFSEMTNYSIVELHEHPAMGNTTDGWNIICTLEKWSDSPFPTFEEFSKLPIFDI